MVVAAWVCPLLAVLCQFLGQLTLGIANGYASKVEVGPVDVVQEGHLVQILGGLEWTQGEGETGLNANTRQAKITIRLKLFV